MEERKIGGLHIVRSSELVSEETRWCTLVYAPPKFGKTTFAATLDAFTKKYRGGPTLFIAVEEAEGGGTMSIADLGVDLVQPKSYQEAQGIVAELAKDTYYKGVVYDSATESVKKFLQPYALKFPNLKEKNPTREVGVPGMSDYQTMGEACNTDFTRLVALTSMRDEKFRKDLLVTALEKDKMGGEKRDTLVAIQPDLPGAMSATATAKFQTVVRVQLRAKVVNGIRTMERYLLTQGDGIIVVGDRTRSLPVECEPDFVIMWEKYWLPRVKALREKAGVGKA